MLIDENDDRMKATKCFLVILEAVLFNIMKELAFLKKPFHIFLHI